MAHQELGEFTYRGIPIRFWRNSLRRLHGWMFVEGGAEYGNTLEPRVATPADVTDGTSFETGVLEDALATIDELIRVGDISDPPDIRGPGAPP